MIASTRMAKDEYKSEIRAISIPGPEGKERGIDNEGNRTLSQVAMEQGYSSFVMAP